MNTTNDTTSVSVSDHDTDSPSRRNDTPASPPTNHTDDQLNETDACGPAALEDYSMRA